MSALACRSSRPRQSTGDPNMVLQRQRHPARARVLPILRQHRRCGKTLGVPPTGRRNRGRPRRSALPRSDVGLVPVPMGVPWLAMARSAKVEARWMQRAPRRARSPRSRRRRRECGPASTKPSCKEEVAARAAPTQILLLPCPLQGGAAFARHCSRPPGQANPLCLRVKWKRRRGDGEKRQCR